MCNISLISIRKDTKKSVTAPVIGSTTPTIEHMMYPPKPVIAAKKSTATSQRTAQRNSWTSSSTVSSLSIRTGSALEREQEREARTWAQDVSYEFSTLELHAVARAERHHHSFGDDEARPHSHAEHVRVV